MHRSILEKYPIHLYLNHLPIPSAEQGTVNNPYKRIQSEEAPLLFTIEETFLISCSIKKDESFTSDLDEISPRPKQQDRTTRGSHPLAFFFQADHFFIVHRWLGTPILSSPFLPRTALSLSEGKMDEGLPRTALFEGFKGRTEIRPSARWGGDISPVNFYHISESFVGLASAWPMPNGPREFSRYRAWLSSASFHQICLENPRFFIPSPKTPVSNTPFRTSGKKFDIFFLCMEIFQYKSYNVS